MTHPSSSTIYNTLQLPTKLTTNLGYSLHPGDCQTTTLVVFLNGLLLPQSSWQQTILQLKLKISENEDVIKRQPHLLSYDRFGQGLSDKHPAGEHDILDVVDDLHAFLFEVSKKEKVLDMRGLETGKQLHLVFVCNSIGCGIARIFASTYPSTPITGVIFLDSIIANRELVSLFPDPDDGGFDLDMLPEGTTVEELRRVREEYEKRFSSAALNPEALDRRNLKMLLPFSDAPKIEAEPWITVIGHDWNTFAEENEKTFNIPKALIMSFINPAWHEYNQGLAKLTVAEKSKQAIAKECGHFIQRDDAGFVADEICDMLGKMGV